jgi:hypothetical protein
MAIFNVRDYGAVGDGSHDDTSAILTTTGLARDAGGGEVYLPAGIYAVATYQLFNSSGGTVKSAGVTIRGDAPQASRIKLISDYSIPLFAITGASATSHASWFKMQDITLDGNNKVANWIQFYRASLALLTAEYESRPTALGPGVRRRVQVAQRLRVHDTRSGETLFALPTDTHVRLLALSPDASHVATVNDRQQVEVWEVP